MDRLFEAVLELESADDCYAFFEDLCTVGELHAMAQRFAVAERLDQGLHYQEIASETGASTATISRVKRCLEYGADGYRSVLDRLKDAATE
jgi:TrpR-related protein YerC/YecD